MWRKYNRNQNNLKKHVHWNSRYNFNEIKKYGSIFKAIMTIVFPNLIKYNKIIDRKDPDKDEYVEKNHTLLKSLESKVLYMEGF